MAIVSGPDSVDSDFGALRRLPHALYTGSANYPIVARAGIFGFRPACHTGIHSTVVVRVMSGFKSSFSMKIYKQKSAHQELRVRNLLMDGGVLVV